MEQNCDSKLTRKNSNFKTTEIWDSLISALSSFISYK